jgi:hypothetical protein
MPARFSLLAQANRYSLMSASTANFVLMRNLAFVSVKLLLKVSLGIDRPTKSTHRRFELPVETRAYSNDWS